ncbi:Shikimate dehydrogenase [Posidoniimonas polymericola]|uniref:Multifunctional fusion protein n=1 Tax=Posidoniimonas polymericola TaxID=2528002 RepID=A0A5C5YTJ4_9BACT|nr:shikimate dehydrogenase [Posidoniimonas polymericola]TWT77977.1 Shikimate dehydrogenase [Posidoniimonas polymericola]
MICVSIGRSRHKHMLAEHKHLVEQGAKLVELRLDYISTRVNLHRLVVDRPCPVIVTCRREEDGGKFTGDEAARQTLLREAIAMGVDYVDIEDDIADKIPRYGKTKRIISHHNFRHTPADLDSLHAKLAALDPDIVKIATMAHRPDDNLRMLDLVRTSEIPTVGMCMGDIGACSRILGAKYGAPFTYATFHHERALAPGQLSYDQMVSIYRHDQINADTEVFGVIADPIAHSLSPHIHNAAFAKAGLNAVYVPFRVPADDLAKFIADVPKLGIKGLSVTIPHKEAIAGSLTKFSPAAKGIGAVNTVLFRDGEVIGGNTDCQAAMDAMEAALGEVGADPSPLKGKRALVLGAGGVSRAIMYGLKKRGVKTTVTSRTRSRSEKLAADFDAKAVDWEARGLGDVDILINGTPIGMHPNVDESPVKKSCLKPSMLVFDTVYNPESTLLIKDARDHGAKVVTGVEMFVRQAELQYQLFTGQRAPEGVMRETLKRVIGPVKY